MGCLDATGVGKAVHFSPKHGQRILILLYDIGCVTIDICSLCKYLHTRQHTYKEGDE